MFGKSNANSSKTWGEAHELIAQLEGLADKKYSSRDFHMFLDGDGVRLTVTINGTEFKGKGNDPWAAAQNLADNAETANKSVMDVLSRISRQRAA